MNQQTSRREGRDLGIKGESQGARDLLRIAWIIAFSNCVSLVACSKLTTVRIERDACTALDCTLICPVGRRGLRCQQREPGPFLEPYMQVVAWGRWWALQKCIMRAKGRRLVCVRRRIWQVRYCQRRCASPSIEAEARRTSLISK